MNKLILVNISELVTCAGTPPKCGKAMSDVAIIVDGFVVINDARVEAVGTMKNFERSFWSQSSQIIDCKGKSVLPGFVDAHTHFVFGGSREEEFKMRLEGHDYMAIMKAGGGIANSVGATRQATESDLYKDGYKRLDDMLAMGVTTVEGKSGYGLDADNELKQLRVMKVLNNNHVVDVVSTFMGPHSLPAEFKNKGDLFIDFMTDQVLPMVVEQKLADFADVFCEEGVFTVDQSRKFLKGAASQGLKLKIHADEICQLGGAELAAELKAVSADHLLSASDQGIKAMADSGVVATLLPGTAFSLKEHYADARKIINSGCAVALATDFNPGSCPTHSIPLIIALSALQMGMTIEEIITGLTINAATAIGRSHDIGSIEVGKKADIIILKHASINFLPYHLAMNLVETVIKNGDVVISATSN